MSKKFLTLNIGASAVALAEYESGGSKLKLLKYGKAQLAAPLDSVNADTVLSPALLEIVREKGIKPGKVAVAVSSQMVFPRIAAIPFAGNDEEKFDQLVRYEIEQNIPFPADEMVCDRQILGETESGDKSVLIVAAKVDQVEAITSALTSAGFSPSLIDVASLSVVNTYKAMRGDSEGCVVLLDIGAKTTSLAIVEGDKLYNRSIPVAGNTLTKEISQALGCTLQEADQIKCENAYVSMGGVTEDEDETLDRISKVCRAVLTRLHAEISRSINFYRSQQGGSLPTKLYLTGGSALLPQIDRFFSDTLQIEVEYLNPFESIDTSPSLDEEELSTDSVILASTAGLAYHEAKISALSINLMPPSIIEERSQVAKIPFVAAGAVSLIAASVCLFLSMGHNAEITKVCNDRLTEKLSSLKNVERRVVAAQKEAMTTQEKTDELRKLLLRRGATVAQINAVRKALGSELWIEKWADGKITVRGWKDRVAAFSEAKNQPASDIVVESLKANPIVDAESVKVPETTMIGAGDSLVQFVVEVKFK